VGPRLQVLTLNALLLMQELLRMATKMCAFNADQESMWTRLIRSLERQNNVPQARV
jgi:hypothetical protein